MSEQIYQACRHLPIQTPFTSKNALRKALMEVKTTTPSETVVYAIYCECGDVYIGETGRNLKTSTRDL